MYCSTCGTQIADHLKYCSSCGDRLAKDDDKHGTPGKMLDNILTTIFLVVMFGLGILVGLVAVLLGNEVKPDAVMLIATVYLLVIFGICFTLVRQVPKLIDARLKGSNNTADTLTPQLQPRTAAQLDEYREPAMSVTDHTTKTLDKVPVERN